jgi:hypothetical protein
MGISCHHQRLLGNTDALPVLGRLWPQYSAALGQKVLGDGERDEKGERGEERGGRKRRKKKPKASASSSEGPKLQSASSILLHIVNQHPDKTERQAGLEELFNLREAKATAEGKEALLKAKEELLQKERMETLRAEGLLSSRGVLERFLQLHHGEQRFRGRFNATDTIRQLTQAGRWGNSLVWAVKECHGHQIDVRRVLQDLYSKLSEEIHGRPWDTNAVLIDDSLPDKDKCVLRKLCEFMGLM